MAPDESQAFATENRIRTADVIGAFSLAADLAIGLPAEHALRSCWIALQMADEMELSPTERVDLYYTELLVDAGCTAWASQTAAAIDDDEVPARRELVFETDMTSQRAMLQWLLRYMAPNQPIHGRARRILNAAVHQNEFLAEGFRNAFEVAERLAGRLGMPEGVRDALLGLPKQWGARGAWTSRRAEIPLLSRLAYMTIVLEVAHRSGGREGAQNLLKERAGKVFDPILADAFSSASDREDFWEPLEGGSVWEIVQAAEPVSSYQYLPAERLPEIAETFADFVDLKVPHTAGHSRRVAEVALRVGRRLLLPPAQLDAIRIAGMTHDVGLVAVPSFTLGKSEERLTSGEWEAMRLHPYHGERILGRAPPFRGAASLVGAHHEREDGRGYYRGSTGHQVPLGACVLAVADRFDELTHAAPGHAVVEVDDALTIMRKEDHGTQWLTCVEALAQESGETALARKGRRASTWPAGLTDREVEVIRTLSQGLSSHEMADYLSVSDATLRHHLEHIYGKIGVTTRVAAILFAMEQGLLS